jgi:hypothetical protein
MLDERSPQTGKNKQLSLNSIRGNWVLGAIALAWAGVVYAAYYMVHKPFATSHLEAVAAVLITIITWVASLILAHALSRIIPFDYKSYSASERLAFRLGLGLGLLSLALIAVGWLPVYRPWLAWGAVLIAVPIGIREFVRDTKALVLRRPSSLSEWLLVCFVVLMLLIAFILALAPPTAWDSLVYHLTGPKLYLEAQTVNHDVDLPYLGFPNGGSMLFLWGLMLSGPELSQLLHWTFALLSLPIIFAIANRLAPGRGWLACALLIGVPSAALLASWAYVEWLTMFAGLAAFSLMFPPGRSNSDNEISPSTRALVLAGVFMGVALSAKYTSIGLLIGLLIALVVQRRKIASVVPVVATAALFIAPFLIKNLALTGNPVYPFFFDGVFWDSLRAFWYSRPGTGLSFLEVLLAPWEITIWGVEGAIVEGHRPYGATIGPALLTLLPFGIIGLRSLPVPRRELLRALLVVASSAYLVWIILLTFSDLLVQTRLLFPALPFIVLLATHGFHSIAGLGKPGRSVQFILGGLVAFGFVLTVIAQLLDTASSSPLQILIGEESERNYLVRELGAFQLAMEEINRLPDQSRVLFLWEPRSYYCAEGIDCQPDALLDRWWHDRRLYGDEAAIAKAWDLDGATHVLLFNLGAEEIRHAGFDPLTQEDWDTLDRFIATYTVLDSESSGPYSLYRFTRDASSDVD